MRERPIDVGTVYSGLTVYSELRGDSDFRIVPRGVGQRPMDVDTVTIYSIQGFVQALGVYQDELGSARLT